jgi:GT2 family glycosyltransferase
LECYENQSHPINNLILVDNCSSDGTVDFLKQWEKGEGNFRREALYLDKNTGGAGGFGFGMEFALRLIDEGKLRADWILVSDDDAFPEPDAIKCLVDFYERLNTDEQNEIASVSSAVINHGEIHLAHRSKIQKNFLRVRFVGIDTEAYKKTSFEMDLFSYVGTMIKVEALRKAGTTNKDLFIYGDDNEHSFRLKQFGKLVCVPQSHFIHDTPGVETRKIGWHNYYNRRNQLYILKKYFPKRYLFTRICKRYILDISPLSKNTKDERKLFLAAQQDALAERLGKHSLYKPGFDFK